MAKASGIFTGLTVAEVEEIRAAVVKQLKAGKSIMSYSDTGVSVSKAWPIDPREVMAECNYALKVLDPDTYGSVRSTRRVHANFSATSEL